MQEVDKMNDAEITAPDTTHQSESLPGEVEAYEANLAAESLSEKAGEEEGFLEVSDFVAEAVTNSEPGKEARDRLKAVIEAAVYITDEPLSTEQIATAVEQPLDVVQSILQELVEEYAAPSRGLAIRELAGGYKLSTKPEHHEDIRKFVKRLQAPFKLSLAALETLAVIAYKQPITGPEIMDIRGVQGAGVVKTLLDRKLIAPAGRKNVLGKPMMYKTTRDFLVQFGLSSLAELPTLKEFEELGRLALSDGETDTPDSRDATRGTTQTAAGGAPEHEPLQLDLEAAEEEQGGEEAPVPESDAAEADMEDSGETVKQNNG
jgi:segregation and condensation protein B